MSDRREEFLRSPTDDVRNPDSYPASWSGLQRRRMALDHHPATGLPFASDGATCGTCGNCFGTSHASNRIYYKCRIAGPVSHGRGTDIRLGWPACREWTEGGEI